MAGVAEGMASRTIGASLRVGNDGCPFASTVLVFGVGIDRVEGVSEVDRSSGELRCDTISPSLSSKVDRAERG